MSGDGLNTFEKGPEMTGLRPHGMIIPLTTPFREDESLDLDALRRLTRRMIEAGVYGLFAAGSTGEFFALSAEESYQVIECVVDETARRVPVYAGACAITTRETIKRARDIAAMGVDAIVVVTPYYMSPSQDELYAHYAAIAASTSLPVIPYNNPGRTGGVNITPDTLVRLAEIDNLIAIKDSSGNMAQTSAYINQTPDGFAVFQGLDSIFLPSLAVGAVGGIAGAGNAIPDIVVELYTSFVAGEYARAREAQVKVAVMRQAMTLGTFPAGLKAAMEMIGQPVGPARRPVAPLNKQQKDTLTALLARIGLLASA